MNKKELKKIQMSESIFVGVLLAFSGGLMDAYTYVFRGGVFANAQTGNLILLGINVFDGSFHNALKYLFPVLSFTCGVLLAQVFRLAFQKGGRFHWRHLSLFLEIVLLTAVSLMSTDNNLPANCMVSSPAAFRCKAFRKSAATTLPPPCASAICARQPTCSQTRCTRKTPACFGGLAFTTA